MSTEQDSTPAMTVNIRLVACPRTVREAETVKAKLSSVTPVIGDERIESTLSTVPHTSSEAPDQGPSSSSDRFPRIRSLMATVSTDPESHSSDTWGIPATLRYHIGRLGADTLTRTLRASISARLIRHERHTETTLSESSPDLLVVPEELPSLLVTGRETTDKLAAAFEDDPVTKPPSAEQSSSYVADEATTQPMPTETSDETYLDHQTTERDIDWSDTEEP